MKYPLPWIVQYKGYGNNLGSAHLQHPDTHSISCTRAYHHTSPYAQNRRESRCLQFYYRNQGGVDNRDDVTRWSGPSIPSASSISSTCSSTSVFSPSTFRWSRVPSKLFPTGRVGLLIRKSGKDGDCTRGHSCDVDPRHLLLSTKSPRL